MKRAALYVRVSTVDQHPETQLYDLRQLAHQRGYEIVREYSDRISGAKAKRPGLDQLMADARRRRFDVLMVWAFDRMARSVRHFLEILDELNHLGIEFVSFRENVMAHYGCVASAYGRHLPESVGKPWKRSWNKFGTE